MKHSSIFLILLMILTHLTHTMEENILTPFAFTHTPKKYFLGIPMSLIETFQETPVIWVKKNTLTPGYAMHAYFNSDATQILTIPFDKNSNSYSKSHHIWDVATKTIISTFESNKNIEDNSEYHMNDQIFNKQPQQHIAPDELQTTTNIIHELHDESRINSLHLAQDCQQAVSTTEQHIYIWQRYANWTSNQLDLWKVLFVFISKQKFDRTTITEENLLAMLNSIVPSDKREHLNRHWNAIPLIIQAHICQEINKILQL